MYTPKLESDTDMSSSSSNATPGTAGAASASASSYHRNRQHLSHHHHNHTSVEYLDELMEKYAQTTPTVAGLEAAPPANLNQKLEEIRNHLRNELYKQYKLQEGAEKMRSATTDKKRLQHLNVMIKESNAKIDELNQELADLNSFIVITQSESAVVLDPFNSRMKQCFWLKVDSDTTELVMKMTIRPTRSRSRTALQAGRRGKDPMQTRRLSHNRAVIRARPTVPFTTWRSSPTATIN